MNRSIEQTLLSLLPTHNSTLPQPLTELASSLLAQSRHRASTLKADEEVARPYACAHIACDRLKIQLNLPPIDPRPPIPPRIYKRLYNHLDSILPATAATPGRTPGGTPGSKRRFRDAERDNGLGASPGTPSRSRITPSKDRSLAQFRAAGPGTPNKPSTPSKLRLTSSKKPSSSSSNGTPLPPWMRPTVRFLCKELNTTQIGPVIMAGVETIVTPHGKRTTDSWITSNLVPLLGALYLIVWKGVTFPGKDLDQERYIRARKDVVTTLQKARSTLTLPTKGTDIDDGGWEGWTGVKVKDIDNATLHINRHGWLESDWAHGIEDLIAQNADAIDEAMELDGNGNDNGVEVGGGKVRRADTMFQDRYDYLSERKKQEYAVWKEGILSRIKELERGPPTADVMDIDPYVR